jgi:hypothetical protein
VDPAFTPHIRRQPAASLSSSAISEYRLCGDPSPTSPGGSSAALIVVSRVRVPPSLLGPLNEPPRWGRLSVPPTEARAGHIGTGHDLRLPRGRRCGAKERWKRLRPAYEPVPWFARLLVACTRAVFIQTVTKAGRP